MKFATPWRVPRHYLDHPLGRRDRVGTQVRVLRRQLGSRLPGVKAAMPLMDGIRCWTFGFHPMRYEPFARRLVALDRHRDTGNTLYVRPSPALGQRLREAPAARVVGVYV